MKKHNIGKILIVATIILVVLAAVAGIVGSLLDENDLGDSYTANLEGLENAVYQPSGNGFVAASEILSRLYDESGNTLCSLSQSYTSPIVVSGNGHAVIWSRNGTEFSMLHRDGNSSTLTASAGIISAGINDSGWVAVLSGETGYKGSVNVYRADGSNAYRVYLGSGYPVDADIREDSAQIAILTLSGTGTNVFYYSMNSEETQYRWSCDDYSAYELRYLSNGRILLLGADAVVFLTEDGRELGRYSYADEVLEYCDTGSERFVALFLSRYKTGSAGKLILLDTNGGVKKETELSGDVLNIRASNKYLAVQYQDRLELFTEELEQYGCLNGTAGIQAAFMRSDGSILIISGGGAGIFDP